jgi:hypothetical protein
MHVHNAFRLASAAAGVDVVRRIVWLRRPLVKSSVQNVAQVAQGQVLCVDVANSAGRLRRA